MMDIFSLLPVWYRYADFLKLAENCMGNVDFFCHHKISNKFSLSCLPTSFVKHRSELQILLTPQNPAPRQWFHKFSLCTDVMTFRQSQHAICSLIANWLVSVHTEGHFSVHTEGHVSVHTDEHIFDFLPLHWVKKLTNM